jgi:hypothetical protein
MSDVEHESVLENEQLRAELERVRALRTRTKVATTPGSTTR